MPDDQTVGNGECAHCREPNPDDRWLYCSDACSEASRAEIREERERKRQEKTEQKGLSSEAML